MSISSHWPNAFKGYIRVKKHLWLFMFVFHFVLLACWAGVYLTNRMTLGNEGVGTTFPPPTSALPAGRTLEVFLYRECAWITAPLESSFIQHGSGWGVNNRGEWNTAVTGWISAHATARYNGGVFDSTFLKAWDIPRVGSHGWNAARGRGRKRVREGGEKGTSYEVPTSPWRLSSRTHSCLATRQSTTALTRARGVPRATHNFPCPACNAASPLPF